jgi:hypothetical protein
LFLSEKVSTKRTHWLSGSAAGENPERARGAQGPRLPIGLLGAHPRSSRSLSEPTLLWLERLRGKASVRLVKDGPRDAS